MALCKTEFVNAVISDVPVFHPPYRNVRTRKIITSRLIFDVAINTQKWAKRNTSFYPGIIMWGKMAEMYAHMLYKGKFVHVWAKTETMIVPAKYKTGQMIVELDGTPFMIPKITYTVDDIELGHDSYSAVQYRNEKAKREVQAGIRLPAWNEPDIKRESGSSDFQIHLDWYRQYLREPYAGQRNWYGHAKVVVNEGQDEIIVTGTQMRPPRPEQTKEEHGDYFVDGERIPFDVFVAQRQELGVVNPITDMSHDPEICAMDETMGNRLDQSAEPTLVASSLLDLF